ncbi:S-adenosylmethionine sensor upstream of mTORC1 isoform X1 [Patella vulgata]|uniref:S-adenosylmethionine sensor upstream of mTORC1 isoform X1 n=2 Tax=Patella vulgata TaxID=6465 RepID=UPI0021801FCF|nr:S-adenosylmethionine sensor upstream of mTORC1 isoform X1 [Patella vulgata]
MSDDSVKQEHKRLAGVVKGVHANLRKKLRSNDGDFHEVWESHCQNKELLAEYADAMHQLATDHWERKRETRIDWCYETIMSYFHHGGLKKIFEKEIKKLGLAKAESSDATVALDQSSDASFVHMRDTTENLSQNSSSNSTSCDMSTANAVVFNSVDFEDSSWEEISINVVPSLDNSDTANQSQDNAKTNQTRSLDSAKTNTIRSLDSSKTKKTRSLDSAKTNNTGSLDSQGRITSSDVPHVSSLMDSILQDCNASSINSESIESSEESAVLIISDTETNSESSNGTNKEQNHTSNQPCLLYNQITLPFKGKIRLLDVGSCYNPFIEFDEIHAVGIDISPAKPSVYHCDFLNLETSEPLQLAADTLDTYISGLKDPIEKLPRDIFHVCVFSLLLEYFPSHYQRWMCCQKAWELLVLNGILIIITPDSHGQHRNAPMIKSWKMAIESMGFKRWRYVKKEHIHCMAFRKVEKPEKNDCLISDVTPDLMYIPQDYKNSEYGESFKPYAPFTVEDEEFFRATMQELPVYPSDDDSIETSEEYIQ